MSEDTIYTVKEMAAALKHSEDYVSDMKRGGFKLPATKREADEWIRQNGPPRRFRELPRTRHQLYGHPRPSCGGGK